MERVKMEESKIGGRFACTSPRKRPRRKDDDEDEKDSSRGCIVVLQPNELETTTDLKNVLIEPKFATHGGTIHSDRIELHCAEKPPVHKGQSLMVRALDPHGE
jgi:hypothetical protein